MSAALDSISRSGENLLRQWERSGQTADSALSSAAASAETTASALDGFGREALDAAGAVEEFANADRIAEDALRREAQAADVAEREINDFGDTSENAGAQSKKFGESSVGAIQDLSKVLAAAGVAKAIHAIYESFAAAVGAAIEFESAITGVYKTVDGSSEQLAQISSEIKAMSLVMPASASEIAAVAESAGQLGIATEDITAFTKVMVDLGEATNLSSDEAASALAKFTNITGMASANYERLGSTVVALGNNFATTEADIVAMSTRMASAGTMAGLAEPEILALAAAMSSVGIEADAGGSAMSKLLTDIQVAVETGSARLDEFASVAGLTGKQFAEVFGGSASDALYAFIAGLNDVERNGATATVILEDMGITEVRLSNAIKSLANNSDGLSSALGFANSAWGANTALANEANLRYGTLESRISMMKNASTNLSIAIGETLTPVIGGFVDVGRGALEWFTGIVERHPAVAAGLTAVAVAVGVVAAAVTAFALVTSPMVITAIHAITAAMLANPIFLIITGVVALTAAVAAFAAVLGGQQAEYDTWTASTKDQYDELQALNAEYENAVEAYGATSTEALALRYEVDELTASFEANKRSVEELVAECDALVEAHNKIVDGYSEAVSGIDYESQGTLSLINKLAQLGQQTNLTAAEQDLMRDIIGKLNAALPGLAINYDSITDSVGDTAAAFKKMEDARARQEKQEQARQARLLLLEQEPLLLEQIAKAEADLMAERARNNMVYNEEYDLWHNELFTEDSGMARDETELWTYRDALDAVQTTLKANVAEQERLSAELAGYEAEAAAVLVSYGEAVSGALGDIQGEMDALIIKYDEVYGAAKSNIDNVIGLFNSMKTETKLSIEDMTAAMQSQSDYLATYTENIRKAAEYGLNDGLIAALSDGSAESAGQLDAIISKIEELGGTTAGAANFISNFNLQFAKVQTAKDEFATTVADMQTNFTTAMDTMERKLLASIDSMNMETEAAAAARDTLSAYVDSIKAGQANAVSAAEAVAAATAAALQRNAGAPSNAYAVGTMSAAPGLALVGENGPELVNFGGGEIVYTAPETERILSDSMSREFTTPVPDNAEAGTSEPRNGYSEKRITLDINGSGSLEVGGNYDEETVWSVMSANLKPLLLSMLKQEIFEEGDLAYAF
jgi:TP901 family phage tail tape measure protein